MQNKNLYENQKQCVRKSMKNKTNTDIHSPIRLFADDTTLYIEVDDPQRAADSY